MFIKLHFFDTDQATTKELFERAKFLLNNPRSRRSPTLAGLVECYTQALQERTDAHDYLQQLKDLQTDSYVFR